MQMERVATKDSIKQDMDRRVGRDVTAKVADVAAASGDETRCAPPLLILSMLGTPL